MSARIRIERSLAEVSAYAADLAHTPSWRRRITTAEWLAEPCAGLPPVGARIRFRARSLGLDHLYTYEVVEAVPGERLTLRTSEGPFPLTTEYTWAPAGPRATAMALRCHGEPTGSARITAPMRSLALRRAMSQDLAALKRLLERR